MCFKYSLCFYITQARYISDLFVLFLLFPSCSSYLCCYSALFEKMTKSVFEVQMVNKCHYISLLLGAALLSGHIGYMQCSSHKKPPTLIHLGREYEKAIRYNPFSPSTTFQFY